MTLSIDHCNGKNGGLCPCCVILGFAELVNQINSVCKPLKIKVVRKELTLQTSISESMQHPADIIKFLKISLALTAHAKKVICFVFRHF